MDKDTYMVSLTDSSTVTVTRDNKTIQTVTTDMNDKWSYITVSGNVAAGSTVQITSTHSTHRWSNRHDVEVLQVGGRPIAIFYNGERIPIKVGRSDKYIRYKFKLPCGCRHAIKRTLAEDRVLPPVSMPRSDFSREAFGVDIRTTCESNKTYWGMDVVDEVRADSIPIAYIKMDDTVTDQRPTIGVDWAKKEGWSDGHDQDPYKKRIDIYEQYDT